MALTSEWKKAEKSAGNGQCVEVSKQGRTVLVRHSKLPEPVISYTEEEWAAFLDGAKKGEFDLA